MNLNSCVKLNVAVLWTVRTPLWPYPTQTKGTKRISLSKNQETHRFSTLTRHTRISQPVNVPKFHSTLCECPEEEIIIRTDLGALRGKILKSAWGREYLAFQGIPYGVPPVGQLRFKIPQPTGPWSGIRDATEEMPPCIQHDPVTGKITGSEDCLYLNVFVPGDRVPNRKAVMVWVTGTGNSSSDTYGPDHLMLQDVILVTFNYRMGPLGFLSMPDAGVPGNAGLKDQIAVLRWVKDHIWRFGGNPNNVTLFGHGSGAVCVHLLTLSPSCKGLLHKAVCQSGCALAPWALKTGEESREQARRLALHLGCNSSAPGDMIKTLNEAPPEKILEGQFAPEQNCEYQEEFPIAPFIPTVEPPCSRGVVLSFHPEYILERDMFNDIPIMFGTNTLDGLAHVMESPGSAPVRPVSEDGDNCLRFVSYLLTHNEISPENQKIIDKRIRDFYFGKKLNKENFLQVSTDINNNHPVMRTLRLMSRRRSAILYHYHFQFDGEWGFSKSLADSDFDCVPGPGHLDLIPYLFCPKSQIVTSDCTEALVSSRVCQMWAKFAKCGTPTPPGDCIGTCWKRFRQDEESYLNINVFMMLKNCFEHRRMAFWDEVRSYIDVKGFQRG